MTCNDGPMTGASATSLDDADCTPEYERPSTGEAANGESGRLNSDNDAVRCKDRGEIAPGEPRGLGLRAGELLSCEHTHHTTHINILVTLLQLEIQQPNNQAAELSSKQHRLTHCPILRTTEWRGRVRVRVNVPTAVQKVLRHAVSRHTQTSQDTLPVTRRCVCHHSACSCRHQIA